MEWSLLAADASVRALDVYSTRRALSCGCNHEAILPAFIAGHTVAMAAYSGGSVIFDWYVARTLERHGHRRLAHIFTSVDLSQDAVFALRNLTLPEPIPGLHRFGK